MSSRKIKYIYNYVIVGMDIKDSAINAGYSISYSNKINSYENWIILVYRVMQLDINEYEYVYEKLKILQGYCEYHEESLVRWSYQK